MEESEKRRERLKAMRVEAAQAEVSNDVGISPAYGSLSNPFIEPSRPPAVQVESSATQRFDFYTDPTAAFSANKKRSQDGDQIRQNYYTPSGARIPDHSHQMVHQSQGPYNNAASQGIPRGMASPFPVHQGTPGVWNRSGHTASYYSSGPYSSQMANPFPTYPGTPEASSRSGSYGFPSNPSMGANMPSAGFQPVGSPRFNHGQGRPHWSGNSPGPPGSRYRGSPGPGHGSERGRGRWYGGRMSPSGRGGGRGSDFHSRDSGVKLGPERFFNKSMVEDPWQHLEPILWKGLHDIVDSSKNPSSSNSLLSKSISTKKAKVSEAYNNSSTQPSLAEYLAAAFNEAVENTPSA